MNATAARWDVRLATIKQIAEAAYRHEQHSDRYG
jgi:hypothetical protein